MAKTKKFSDNVTDWFVTPKTKNIVWEYVGEGSFAFNINIDYDDTKKVFAPYLEKYRNIATREGQNLVVTTIFSKNDGGIKTIKNTFKDYFSSEVTHSVNFSTYELFAEDNAHYDGTLYDYEINPGTNLGEDGLYAQVQRGFVLTPNDSTPFSFTTDAGDYTFAFNDKGDNVYIDADQGTDSIVDLKGKDKYTYSGTKELYIYDYDGKDEYAAEDGYLYLEEYKGNDEYTFKNNVDGFICDKAGSDIYHLQETANVPNLFDYKGNDEYYMTNSSVNIVEHNGKDYYEITGANTTYISDTGKGNDTYKITSSSNLVYDNFLIGDANGKDTYTLNNVSFTANSYEAATQAGEYAIKDENGNDKYSLADSSYLRIDDGKGKDKYTILGNSEYCTTCDNGGNDTYNCNGYDTINDSEQYVSFYNIYDNGKSSDVYKMEYTDNLVIHDDGGKNKFNIKNSKSTILYAENFKDVYNLTNTQNFSVDDLGTTVGDTYTITNSSGYLTDYGGNDSYTLSQLLTKQGINITDKGGTKDKLTLKGLNKNDIVIMANVGKNGYEDNTLILYSKSNGGFVVVNDFFTGATTGDITGFGDGKIETMKAGKKTLSVDYNYLNQVREEASGYLSSGETVVDILSNQEAHPDTVAELIACFTP